MEMEDVEDDSLRISGPMYFLANLFHSCRRVYGYNILKTAEGQCNGEYEDWRQS